MTLNGGSFRIYIRNKGADAKVFGDATYRNLAARRVRAIREQEIRLGLNDLSTYQDSLFSSSESTNDIVDFIRTEVGRGKKVYVYGASTKGNTVLQYFGLDHALITAAAERNPDKWGRVTVGSRIPIISEGEARSARPDYFLMLPWHFLEEFQARERDFLFLMRQSVHHAGATFCPDMSLHAPDGPIPRDERKNRRIIEWKEFRVSPASLIYKETHRWAEKYFPDETRLCDWIFRLTRDRHARFPQTDLRQEK